MKKKLSPSYTVNLKTVSSSDHKFLFELLSQRKSYENISHKKMPTFEEHVKFVISRPYSKWYIVRLNSKKVGYVYLTHQNEIGIHVIEEVRGKNVAKQALELIMKKNPKSRYLANINPKNKKSIKFFTKNCFKLIQYTYELIPVYSKN